MAHSHYLSSWKGFSVCPAYVACCQIDSLAVGAVGMHAVGVQSTQAVKGLPLQRAFPVSTQPCRQRCRHSSHTARLTQRHSAAASGTAAEPCALNPDDPSQGPAVLVVPAFYLDAQVFKPFVQELRSRGFNAALPPVRWTDWVPTLGGRSVRPILDRMDWALTQLLEGYQVSDSTGLEVPLPRPATYQDWLTEFRDASKGAQPQLELTGPWQGSKKAALVASSAGGWISRIFLGRSQPYSNTVYHGADRVHTLVTLGTPHTSAEPVTRRNIDYVNEHYNVMDDVRYYAIGSKTVQGKAWLNGSVQDFAYQSYNICCGKGDVWGDGVTPLECALALEGAEHIVMEGAKHVPLEAKPDKGIHWYGSGPYLEEWINVLHPVDCAAALTSKTARSSGSSL